MLAFPLLELQSYTLILNLDLKWYITVMKTLQNIYDMEILLFPADFLGLRQKSEVKYEK